MKRNSKILFSIIGVLLLFLAAAIYWLTKPNTNTVTQNTQTSTEPLSEQSIYTDLKGEDFDEVYLGDMLAHHEGAVNMAEMAGAQTTRPEILALSQEIMQSQGKEMSEMMTWQEQWGYEKTMGGHASHSGATANEMAGHMMDMTDQLKGLSDEAFDEKFLTLMIEHHQQAIDMSKYADTNAFHEEIKDIASAVITAQEKEIDQMKQWQKNWGYATSTN